jgi:hypothetical protein
MSKVCQKWWTGLTLPENRAANCSRNQVDLAQHLPVAGSPGRVVAGVGGVVGEGSVGVGQVERIRVGDGHRDSERGQRLEDAAMERRHRLTLERE